VPATGNVPHDFALIQINVWMSTYYPAQLLLALIPSCMLQAAGTDRCSVFFLALQLHSCSAAPAVQQQQQPSLFPAAGLAVHVVSH
jgi:hypothetical protein